MASRKEEVEHLAKWLNEICVDWPPISVDWETSSRNRRLMRTLAREYLNKRDVDFAPPQKSFPGGKRAEEPKKIDRKSG